MKNVEEQDDLWRLLGKAKRPAVSPFFSRNVLREIRPMPRKKTGVFFRLRAQWRIAALGGAAVVLLAANAARFFARPEIRRAPPVEIADYETINHLDELLAYEQSSIWTDDSSQ